MSLDSDDSQSNQVPTARDVILKHIDAFNAGESDD